MTKDDATKLRIPRFTYQVPDDVAEIFLQEMHDDVRDSAGDLISAILRKYFRAKMAGAMLQRFDQEVDGDPGEPPTYGPKPPTPAIAPTTKRFAGDI